MRESGVKNESCDFLAFKSERERGIEREPWKKTKFESENGGIDHKLGY